MSNDVADEGDVGNATYSLTRVGLFVTPQQIPY